MIAFTGSSLSALKGFTAVAQVKSAGSSASDQAFHLPQTDSIQIRFGNQDPKKQLTVDLSEAVKAGDEAKLRQLIPKLRELDMDINAIRNASPTKSLQAESEEDSLLKLAARAGHAHLVGILLDAGCDASMFCGQANNTPLMTAAYLGKFDVVKALARRGVDINQKAPDGQTALIHAASGGQVQIMEYLLKLGTRPNATTNKGWSALTTAVAKGHDDAVTLLLDDPSVQFYLKNMAIHRQSGRYTYDGSQFAAALEQSKSLRPETIRRFVKAYRPDQKELNQALYKVCRASKVPTDKINWMEALVQQGANVNARASRLFDFHRDEANPLMAAAVYYDVETVEWLLQHGAYPTPVDPYGKPSIDSLAPRAIYPDVLGRRLATIALLQRYGAQFVPEALTSANERLATSFRETLQERHEMSAAEANEFLGLTTVADEND